MKKFGDLPVYFIILGLILNVILYFYNEVSFVELMVRSMFVIVVFAVTGYFVAKVLDDAHYALKNTASKRKTEQDKQKENKPTIDIRVQPDSDEELLKMIPQTKDDEFEEFNPDSFRQVIIQDDDRS